MGANEVHKQLRRSRLHRIKFLKDRKQRLVLIFDRASTETDRLRRVIDDRRRTQLQTRQAFTRKQTELEVVRHKLVLCLEAANAADEERKDATRRRVEALEREETERAVRRTGGGVPARTPLAAPTRAAIPLSRAPPFRLPCKCGPKGGPESPPRPPTPTPAITPRAGLRAGEDRA